MTVTCPRGRPPALHQVEPIRAGGCRRGARTAWKILSCRRVVPGPRSDTASSAPRLLRHLDGDEAAARAVDGGVVDQAGDHPVEAEEIASMVTGLRPQGEAVAGNRVRATPTTWAATWRDRPAPGRGWSHRVHPAQVDELRDEVGQPLRLGGDEPHRPEAIGSMATESSFRGCANPMIPPAATACRATRRGSRTFARPVELAETSLDASQPAAGDDGVGHLASHLGDQLDVLDAADARPVRLHAEHTDHPLVAAGRDPHVRAGVGGLLAHQAPQRDAGGHQVGDGERLLGVEDPLGDPPESWATW